MRQAEIDFISGIHIEDVRHTSEGKIPTNGAIETEEEKSELKRTSSQKDEGSNKKSKTDFIENITVENEEDNQQNWSMNAVW